jgi:hypothetical protein
MRAVSGISVGSLPLGGLPCNGNRSTASRRSARHGRSCLRSKVCENSTIPQVYDRRGFLPAKSAACAAEIDSLTRRLRP